MVDRAVNKIFETSGADRVPVVIANGVTLPIGSLAQFEAGFANHYTGVVTNSLAGLVVGGENVNSDGEPVGDTSLSPQPKAYIDMSGAVLKSIPVASATVAGVYVYCNDSDLDNATITQPSTDDPIGMIVRFGSASDCDVKLFSPTEHIIGSNAPNADAALPAWT